MFIDESCSSLLQVLIGLLHEIGKFLLRDVFHGDGGDNSGGGGMIVNLPTNRTLFKWREVS
jgi:hypothetical protein